MAATGWEASLETQSSVGDNNMDSPTLGLVLGMSGMSLLPHSHSEDVARSCGDSVHSHHSAGTASSTARQQHQQSFCRPPGLSVSGGPPPISKPGHARTASNASTTLQTAQLTPTSSLDGGANGNDIYSIGRHHASSPSSEHLPGISTLGASSFETDDGDNDGLLGLHALRDRSYSSPGPHTYSSSPREFGNARSILSGRGRPRTVSKDCGRSQSVTGSRPPLAGGSALLPQMSDLSMGYGGAGVGNRSRDASPPPNAGIISRPYSPHGSGVGSVVATGTGNEYDRSFDSSLSRALSSDSGIVSEYGSGSAYGADHKFTPMPLTSNSRSNSGGSLYGQGVYQQRAQRSYSQPGPTRGSPPSEYYADESLPMPVNRRGEYGPPHGATYHTSHRVGCVMEPMDHHYGNEYYPHDMRYGGGEVGNLHQHTRSLSMQQTSTNASFTDSQRRGSTGYYGGPLRDVDYEDERRFYDPNRIGNTHFPRQERMVSPAHSPMHGHYASHSRASSDMGSTVSSSPMSFSSQPLYGRHRMSQSDEDLSHPLVGEHIEVPGEDQYYNEGMVSYLRTTSTGHTPSYGVDSHHVPNAEASMYMPKIVYNVKFKRTQRTFELGPRLNRDLKVGTYVKVEADRGEDLGIVIGKVKNPSTGIRSSTGSFGGGMGELPSLHSTSGDMKKVIRLATHDEVNLLQVKREEEEELLKVCRAKARQRGLPMHVVDAEYQFDRHKLTFFFEAEGRIDFRELVRDLFSMYKTRIWMQQLDKNSSVSCPVAPAPDPLVMDQGTPIIAPASEYEDFAPPNTAVDDYHTD